MKTATPSSKGRIALTTAGAIVLVLGALVIAAGGAALWQTGKSDSGYISSGVHRFDTTSHAIVTEDLKVDSDIPRWLIGHARITASPSVPVVILMAIIALVGAYTQSRDASFFSSANIVNMAKNVDRARMTIKQPSLGESASAKEQALLARSQVRQHRRRPGGRR